jgi:predicted  nucleic acid-binding Zn-ribbon protein
MHADLESLVVLQAQDLELRRLRAELAAWPARVKDAEQQLATATRQLAALEHSLASEETLRRSHELEIASHKSKSARLQKQMETAANAAQITALEHEIHFAAEAVARLEDEELASMERTEQLDAARATALETKANSTDSLATMRERSTAETASLQQHIAGIEHERTQLRAQIGSTETGASMLSAYDRIAKSKGTALSEAIDHKCSACQMMVRPQRWNDLTGREHDHEVFHCETCGRMLFFDPRHDRPVQWAAGDRLKQASHSA